MQPFADLDSREETVPAVDLGTRGPPRCGRCGGYINPWCTWVAGVMRWKCNLCGHETEGMPLQSHLFIWSFTIPRPVSTEYFSNLGPNMLRMDHAQIPELNRGTVDFVVAEDYWTQHPPKSILRTSRSICH